MPVIKRLAQDSLTGLLNRESFVKKAQKVISHAVPGGMSVVYLRLVNFGAYSVRYGSKAGDEVLKLVASHLRVWLSSDMVGRIETDGFTALAPSDDVENILHAINKELPASGEVDGLMLKAGYCIVRSDMTLDDAMVRAQYAYEDIQLRSPAFSRLFDSGLETVFNRRAYVREHLDDAIQRGEIRAYAQSIVRVLTGMICEVEILARWVSEEYGFLRPDEFIPELERHRLIYRLDAEVVRLACKQWAEASKLGINVPFGINLSRLDFELCDMYQIVRDAMKTYDVPIDQVHIEITESALAQSSELLMKGIRQFRDDGFELYLDDFGSGYSSLQVLEGTSFDVVKLDMSLLREVEDNERARVIVADAISMIKRLNLQTLCEGVETEEQFLFLKAVGCEKAQGYYFAKPMEHEGIMEHLEETVELHETAEDMRYYDSVGKVNLIDGTRASVQGVEAAHFQGNQPFAIVEIRGQKISFLSANTAFNRFVAASGSSSIDDFVNRLGSDLSDIRNKLFYTFSKALSTGMSQPIDFVLNGSFCSVGISHIESSEGRDAYLLEILSVTRYSQFNDFKLLENSLRFLYTIFKRIDLLDVTDNSWRNIYLNVPRYHSLRAGATPQDEIDAFCEKFIHPDDRNRFLEFYDLDTVDERLRHVPTVHLADTFFALSDNERYEDQLFMLIPVSMDGHRQFLSCMRDLDIEGIARQSAGVIGRINDEVLLSGLLEMTKKRIFWKDSRGRFLGANRRFLDYSDVDLIDEILGKTDEDLGWTHNPSFAKDDELVLGGEQIVDARGYIKRKGEFRSVRVTKLPLWSEGKVMGQVGYIEDDGPYEPKQDYVKLGKRLRDTGYGRVLVLGTVEDMTGTRVRKPLAASGLIVLVPPSKDRVRVEAVLESPSKEGVAWLTMLVEQAVEHGAQAIVETHAGLRAIEGELPLPLVS